MIVPMSFELVIAKYIIIALLLVIFILAIVIFALGKQISEMLDKEMGIEAKDHGEVK